MSYFFDDLIEFIEKYNFDAPIESKIFPLNPRNKRKLDVSFQWIYSVKKHNSKVITETNTFIKGNSSIMKK